MSTNRTAPVLSLFMVSPIKSDWPRRAVTCIVKRVVPADDGGSGIPLTRMLTAVEPDRRPATLPPAVSKLIAHDAPGENLKLSGKFERRRRGRKPATMFLDITQPKVRPRKKAYQGVIAPLCQSSSRYDMLDYHTRMNGIGDLVLRDLEVEMDVGFDLLGFELED